MKYFINIKIFPGFFEHQLPFPNPVMTTGTSNSTSNQGAIIPGLEKKVGFPSSINFLPS